MENKSKVSPQEIYEVLEEQKRLYIIKEKLTGMLDKVNQITNSLAVENLQLNQSIELSDNEEQPETQINSPPEPTFSYNQLEQSELINQQMIEIDLKPFEEIESDEEIDQL